MNLYPVITMLELSVTSQTEITQSLKAAERRLKVYSDKDVC